MAALACLPAIALYPAARRLIVGSAIAEPQVRGAEETAALAEAQRQYDEAQTRLRSIGAKLESTQVEINRTEGELAALRGDISQTESDIDNTSSELTKAQNALAAYLQISYKSGNMSTLDVLLSSRDFNDFVTRSYYVGAIQDSQIETINEIKELKVQLEDQREVLNGQEQEEAALLEKLEQQEAELAQQKADSDAVVSGLSTEVQQLFAAQQAELVAAAEARATAAAAAQQGETIGLYAPGVSQGSIVEDAYACLGIPYVWTGDDENFAEVGGFDCSGFVQHCYALEGYLIGRTTWDQIADIQSRGNWRDDISQLQPGDLVFPNDGHVGIYIGNNQMIDAPYPGMFIQIDDIEEFIGGGCPV